MPINTKPHIHNIVMCANVFIRKDGKYLLLKRSEDKKYAPGVVHPFGGKIDPNESPFQAAQREILEEAGVTLKNMNLEAVVLELSPHKGEDENWLIFHFSADYDSGDIIETEEGKAVLLAQKDIKNQKLFPSLAKIVNHVINPKNSTVFLTMSYDKNGNPVESRSHLDICTLPK